MPMFPPTAHFRVYKENRDGLLCQAIANSDWHEPDKAEEVDQAVPVTAALGGADRRRMIRTWLRRSRRFLSTL
jgi:hypothetical protein